MFVATWKSVIHDYRHNSTSQLSCSTYAARFRCTKSWRRGQLDDVMDPVTENDKKLIAARNALSNFRQLL